MCRPTPFVRFMPMSEQGSKINSCIAWHTNCVHGSVFTRSPSLRNPYTIQLFVCTRTAESIPLCNTPINRVYSRHGYQTNNHAVYPARQRTHRTDKATVWVSIRYRCNTACSPIGGTWGDIPTTQTTFKGLAYIPVTEVRDFTLGWVIRAFALIFYRRCGAHLMTPSWRDHSRTGCAIEARLRLLQECNPTGVEVGKAASYPHSKETRGQEHDVSKAKRVKYLNRVGQLGRIGSELHCSNPSCAFMWMFHACMVLESVRGDLFASPVGGGKTPHPGYPK